MGINRSFRAHNIVFWGRKLVKCRELILLASIDLINLVSHFVIKNVVTVIANSIHLSTIAKGKSSITDLLLLIVDILVVLQL